MQQAATYQQTPQAIRLLGLNFADLEPEAAASVIAARPAQAPFAYVVTPNAAHLVRLDRQPTLLALYQDAWLRLLDSRAVGLAAQALGMGGAASRPRQRRHRSAIARPSSRG